MYYHASYIQNTRKELKSNFNNVVAFFAQTLDSCKLNKLYMYYCISQSVIERRETPCPYFFILDLASKVTPPKIW